MATYKKQYTAVGIVMHSEQVSLRAIITPISDADVEGSGSAAWAMLMAKRDIDVNTKINGAFTRLIIPYHTVDHAYRYVWSEDTELPTDESCN